MFVPPEAEIDAPTFVEPTPVCVFATLKPYVVCVILVFAPDNATLNSFCASPAASVEFAARDNPVVPARAFHVQF